MFKKRILVLSILALLAFSIVGPVSAGPTNTDPEITYTISGNVGVAGVEGGGGHDDHGQIDGSRHKKRRDNLPV